MDYTIHFSHADDVLMHLETFIDGIDPILATKYTGFATVACVTVYELAVKQIFCDFANKKHVILGHFTENFFEKINGKIRVRNIKDDYIKKFGPKYLSKFNRNLQKSKDSYLQAQKRDFQSAYENIVTWRNAFAHEGQLPTQATFKEVKQSYEDGKCVLECLYRCMKR